MKIKSLVLALIVLLLSGCMTMEERFARKTPEEIHRWSDRELCNNGYRNNPAIKSELLNRKLLTEKEFEYIMLTNEHHNFPAKGMPKCAIWTFTNYDTLLNKTVMPDGIIREIWKVHHGEYFISTSWGGSFLLVTIENGRITDVSQPLEK